MNRIRKGDQVIVTSGKDKGRQGTVLNVGDDRILVETVNMVLSESASSGLILTGENIYFGPGAATDIVIIDPDLHKFLPDSESVNRTLRKYVEEHNMVLS